ncbi:MAG: RagB/SusD family nutrient uptake outer membrane protein, partial [Muribaculaceae bacterium]|nr:RagB/SusD family nutrient uptake outer membrane protein [Muribaculaceae bacterium]
MKMNISKFLAGAFIAVASTMALTSCEDYLEKDPDSTVNAEDAFKDYKNFQGFLDEVYNCVPNKNIHYWTCTGNQGEDEYHVPDGNWHRLHHVDRG